MTDTYLSTQYKFKFFKIIQHVHILMNVDNIALTSMNREYAA